jgi:transcriptional regulator with XRE-family HTH domain
MNIGLVLRTARQQAGLTQASLAARAGTSQTTISAYESGAKQPSVSTLTRLLEATGSRLTVEPATRPAAFEPSPAQLARVARTLSDVIALAEALPARHHSRVKYPRLACGP